MRISQQRKTNFSPPFSIPISPYTFHSNVLPPAKDSILHIKSLDVYLLRSITINSFQPTRSVMEQTTLTSPSQSKVRRTLTNQERQAIVETLLKQSENGKAKYGAFRDVAAMFSVSEKTIQRIWKQAKSFIANGLSVDVSRRLTQRVGRKRIEIDPSQILQIPLRKRTNIRSLANAANMAKSTIHRRIKEGVMRPHSNALKPMLTDENKKARLRFCLSKVESNDHDNNPTFNDMFQYVHIDEKWFYMTKESHKYYLLPEEEEPVRTCKSKRFITKVMFLAAVARPRFGPSGNVEFSGKIGIFPFTFKEPAKRNSKNRAAGTIETKPILSVTKDVVRDALIQKVLPAIREKWPVSSRGQTIFIQQDNAKPHIDPNDMEFMEAASRNGFDIRLSFQPPNSPDLNVLDLGFFRAIQTLQHQEAPKTVDELVQAIEKSFEEFSVGSLNRVFLTLQMCMIEAMKEYGGNTYRMPHMGKSQLEQSGNLPVKLTCDAELVENCRRFLEEQQE